MTPEQRDQRLNEIADGYIAKLAPPIIKHGARMHVARVAVCHAVGELLKCVNIADATATYARLVDLTMAYDRLKEAELDVRG